MSKPHTPLITRLNTPRSLIFQVDAIGAGLSLAVLILISNYLAETIGLPSHVLTWLAMIAGVLCMYSTICAIVGQGRYWRMLLRIIAGANITYCLLTWGLAIYYWQGVTTIGWGYFIAESLIICLLATIEIKISQIR